MLEADAVVIAVVAAVAVAAVAPEVVAAAQATPLVLLVKVAIKM